VGTQQDMRGLKSQERKIAIQKVPVLTQGATLPKNKLLQKVLQTT
jgi:hypothetical protein